MPGAGFNEKKSTESTRSDSHEQRSGSSSGHNSLNLQAFATAPSVSVSSLRASLRGDSVCPPARSVSPSRDTVQRRGTISSTATGAIARGGDSSDESGIGGGGSGPTSNISRRKGRSPPRSPKPPGASGFGVRSMEGRRHHRSTTGGSGDSSAGNLDVRRARTAAAQEAVKSAEATAAAAAAAEASAVKGLQQRRASGIPRKVPGAGGSRLAPPGSRLKRPGSASSGLGGSVSAAAAVAVAAAGRDSGKERGAVETLRMAAPAEEDDAGSGVTGSVESSGTAVTPLAKKGVGSGGDFGGRRSFLPRPSPRAGRSSIPRSGSKRL